MQALPYQAYSEVCLQFYIPSCHLLVFSHILFHVFARDG